MCSLVSQVILKDVPNNNNAHVKLVKVNFKDSPVCECLENVDVRVAAKLEIEQLVKKGK